MHATVLNLTRIGRNYVYVHIAMIHIAFLHNTVSMSRQWYGRRKENYEEHAHVLFLQTELISNVRAS